MARKPAAPGTVSAAVAMLRGPPRRSLSEVAAEFNVSKMTIMRWDREAPPGPSTPPPDEGEETPEEPDAEDVASLGVDELNRMMAGFLRKAKAAEAAGDFRGAAALSGHAARLAPVLLRLERERKADGDMLHVSKGEIEAAMRGVYERAAALLERPLLCAGCGKALSVEWGKGIRHP